MGKSEKTALSAEQTVEVIAQLFDLYGFDRSLNRDRSRDGERFQWALYCAVRDGLIRLPRKRGAPAKWKGQLGLELVEAVESFQARSRQPFPKKRLRYKRQSTRFERGERQANSSH
jgi:hypothetical protein